MKNQITLGLIAGALALTTAAFAPTEAQATEQEKRLNQMAMQMYMNNQSIAAQQQYYNYNSPYYYNNAYNNGYNNLYNNGYNNLYTNQYTNQYSNQYDPYYGRTIYGNGYSRNHRYNRWQNNDDFNNRLNFNSSTVGRILNRVF